MLILGLSGGLDPLYAQRLWLFPPNTCHDSAAVLIDKGTVVAAIEEERLNRIKHTNKGPVLAIAHCLRTAGIALDDVDKIAIPWTEAVADWFFRGLYFANSKEAIKSTRQLIHEMFKEASGNMVDDDKLVFVPHHLAHAVSAHYCSGYAESLVFTIDGGGDDISGAVYSARGKSLEARKEFSLPQALGLYYKCVTEFLGYSQFEEYKVMGLAPYGDPNRYAGLLNETYELLPDGEYTIADNLRDILCGAGPRRRRNDPLTQFHTDVAAGLQQALETIVFHVLTYHREASGHRNLCLAGGVAHNCTLNGKIVYSGLFENVFVQPAAHDAGLALGAAMDVFAEQSSTQADVPAPFRMAHVYLGSGIDSDKELAQALAPWKGLVETEHVGNITERAAQLLAGGKIIGWVQGRSEFGPRALGNRSILADPRPAKNRDIINRMVKKREAFRPFAPSVLEEYASEYFEMPSETFTSPFMTFVLCVREDKRKLLGATTHVDGTARIQTVSKTTNGRYWALIEAFRRITGIPVLLNTSFNNNAEPIVDSVEDAIVSFLTTDLHYLVMGDFLIRKTSTDKPRILSLAPSLPKYCTLAKTTACKATQEMARKYELCRNYDDRFNDRISAEMYAVLEVADGIKSLENLFVACCIGDEKRDEMTEEAFRLWSQRSITLRPSVNS